MRNGICGAIGLAVLLAATQAAAGTPDYDLSWHTVDGGGGMWSTGGTYELGGTIGQPDAGELGGGTYALNGGFWQTFDLVLLVRSTPITGVDIAGIPAYLTDTTDYSTEVTEGTPITLTAQGTVTLSDTTYAFFRWILDGVDQTDGETALTFTPTANAEAVALYLAPPGALSIDMAVMIGGALNPNGPGAPSLGIKGVGLNGNPDDTPIAIRLGPGPGGWLEVGQDGDLWATGATESPFLAAEWGGRRIRGLTADTECVFHARAVAPGDRMTSLSEAGTYRTNRMGDCNRSGLATALDYALIRAAILRGTFLWPADFDDSRANDSNDLHLTRDALLNP